MKTQYRKYLIWALAMTAVLLALLYHYAQTRNVTYELTSPSGKLFVQNWVHINQKVLAYEEEGTLYSSFAYSESEGLYFESYSAGGSQVNFAFSKSPEQADVGEMLAGRSFLVEKDTEFPSREIAFVKAIRQIDGRIVCVTTIDEGDGYMRVVTRMFDNKVSNYYLPDEIIDRVFSEGEIVSTVHVVAKGRNFLPIEHVSKDWI